MWTTQLFVAEQNTEKKAPMLPWAAAGPWCCFPFTKKSHLPRVREYF